MVVLVSVTRVTDETTYELLSMIPDSQNIKIPDKDFLDFYTITNKNSGVSKKSSIKDIFSQTKIWRPVPYFSGTDPTAAGSFCVVIV